MSAPRRAGLLTALASTALLTTGCAALGVGDSGPDASSEGGSLEGGRVAVSAAFYPLAFVAERVGGDAVEVTQLTEPGAEPHDLELSVGETAEVARADLVLLEGGFQPAVDDAAGSGISGRVLDARDVVELAPLPEHAGEHGEEHGGEEHGGEEHGHGDDLAGLDPHFWLDPLRLAEYADALATELGEIDPDRAEDYEARAADLRDELGQLDTAYAQGLQGCERDVIVVNHDAFGYLTRYGLEFEPISGLSPDAEPSPAQLAELQETATREGVTTVFSERLVSRRTAETLAQDLGIEVGVLDPVEGLTPETTDEDYLSLMRQNLTSLQEANGC